VTKREWQIEMANRFAKRDKAEELINAQDTIRQLEEKLKCYERLADASEMASNPMGVKSRVALRNVREMKTIMTKEEEIRQAVEAEREAWMDDYNACKCSDNETRCFSDRVFRMMQKYTTPPQRTWAGLTDKEMLRLYNEHIAAVGLIGVFRAIEAKLKEKNT
jgi:hypothetical protein